MVYQLYLKKAGKNNFIFKKNKKEETAGSELAR